MTESQIIEAVREMATARKKEVEFAEFCHVYAPGYITGCLLFGPVLWESGFDASYQSARLQLLAAGYHA